MGAEDTQMVVEGMAQAGESAAAAAAEEGAGGSGSRGLEGGRVQRAAGVFGVTTHNNTGWWHGRRRF